MICTHRNQTDNAPLNLHATLYQMKKIKKYEILWNTSKLKTLYTGIPSIPDTTSLVGPNSFSYINNPLN